MAREDPHGFPATQVLMDLAVNQPFRTHGKDSHGGLHVCFDKKLKQNAFNNLLLSHTPYRCSLGRQKEDASVVKQRTKPTSKDRPQDLSLPKIPLASHSLIGRTFIPEENSRKQGEKRLIDSHSEDEEPSNFLFCKSLTEDQNCKATTSRPLVNCRKETRSRSLPLILKKGDCSSFLRTSDTSGESLNHDEVQTGQNYSTKIDSIICNRKKNSSHDQEFTTVMEDGARITVYRQRLSIEVFMPRTS